MTITERERLVLVDKLEKAMGREAASTLMEYLPATGWRDVTTVTDLENLRLDLRTEMAELRTELKTEMAELRTELKTEMAELRTELKIEMAELRGDMKAGDEGLRAGIADLRAELERQLRRQTVWMIATMISLLAVMASLNYLKR